MYWKKKEKKEGYPLVLYTVNPSTSSGASQCCSVQNLPSPCPPSRSSGGGAAPLTLRCVHLGEMPHPHRVPGSVGAVDSVRPLFPGGPAPSRAQDDTRRNTPDSSQLPSPGVSSHSNYHSLPVRRGLDALSGGGGGVLTCTARGRGDRSILVVLRPPHLCLSRGESRILGCVPGALGSGAFAAVIAFLGPQLPKAAGCSPLHLEPELLPRPSSWHTPAL